LTRFLYKIGRKTMLYASCLLAITFPMFWLTASYWLVLTVRDRFPEAARFERVDVFDEGGGGTFLLAVAWILWKGGPFRTEAYAFSGKRCAALTATTDNP
jgi:hypothetical protein